MKTQIPTPPAKPTAASTPPDKELSASHEQSKAEVKEEKEVGVPAMEFVTRSLNRNKKPEKAAAAAPVIKKEGDEEPKPKKVIVKKAAAPAPAAPFDETKFGEAVGRTVAEAIKPKEAAKPEPDADLPPKQKRRVQVMRQMEKQFGDEYKGLAGRYLDGLKKWQTYSDKWKAEHPGEDFDEEAEIHDEFRAPIEAESKYDEDDFNDAFTEIKLAEKTGKPDETTQKLQEKVERLETAADRKERFDREQPKIRANMEKAGDSFWQKAGERFKDFIDEKGSLKPAALRELATSDPETYNIAVNGYLGQKEDGTWIAEGARNAEWAAYEVHLLGEGLSDYFGDIKITSETPLEQKRKITVHKFISDSAFEQEKKMLQREPDKQLDGEGRTFLSRADYSKLPQAQRDQHWTFTHEDLGFLIAARIAKDTKARLEAEEQNFNRRAQSRGLIAKSPSTPSSQRRNGAEPELESDDDDEKPQSPSSPFAPKSARRGAAITESDKAGVNGFVLRSLKKS